MTIQYKVLKLRDDTFLEELTSEGSTYDGYDLDTEVTIVAVEGSADDWAAYFSTPWQQKGMINPAFQRTTTAMYGVKLPEAVATRMFPEWAKLKKWRP
jgi:hypothetical protein